MENDSKGQILDELYSADVSAQWLEKIQLKRNFWWRWSWVSALIFAFPFSSCIFIAYRYVPRDLARLLGSDEGIERAQALFLTLFCTAFFGFLAMLIGVMRQAFLPYLPTWSEAQCRAHASQRARIAFALTLLLWLPPLWLYFNVSLADFGNAIGVPPGRQSSGTSEALLAAAILLGALALFRAAVYARRAYKYVHPSKSC